MGSSLCLFAGFVALFRSLELGMTLIFDVLE